MGRAPLPLLLVLAGVGITACSDPSIRQASPWPNDAWIVVALAEGDQRPSGDPIILAPGQPLLVEADPERLLRVYAWAFPPEDQGGPRFRSCGLGFGGDGPRVRHPLGSWQTALSAPDALSFSEGGVEALERFDLREGCEGDPCEHLGIEIFPAPFVDRQLEFAVALDDQTVILSSDLADNAGGFDLWRVHNGEWSPIPASGGLDGPPSSLELDPERGVVVGALADGRTFEWDPEQGLLRTGPTIPVGFSRSAFGPGRWVRYGGGGLQVERGPPIPSFSSKVVSLLLLGPQSAVLSSTAGLQYWDGAGGFRMERANKNNDQWTDLASNGQVLAASGRSTEVLVRDNFNALWTSSGRAFAPDRDLHGLVAFGMGQLLLVGDSGFLAIYQPLGGVEGACVVDPVPVVPHLLDLSLAPSGRFAFAVSDHVSSAANDHPLLLRIELP